MRPWGAPLLDDDTGSVTVEAAIALAALVVAVVACIGALLAASTQVRCVDAAREAARLTARGDVANAVPAARAIAPPGADISVRLEGSRILAIVTAGTPLLPLLELRAEAVATPEPGAEP
ncbi:pilus assembly protein TadE [Nocardia cyriacigeorgica]|uniref:TadE family type IV pilus minor pilin n=1 Tax=Nocardia cyriacigeorgica TaxID=135487 RepID=UPI000305A4B9|nr:TadE family type IV pilus minor pilin [Nocardia cyriacigeorgica]AVH21186.1 pilus assembly protein TadE [Nocardia cyriacigeorgica]MBF6087550.1 pilus assembly protein TadE [Nocardia cyriacigeorgica]MBF6092519.1 pilus assembly protein TadE [Nocardia cyriacigeorgica]MBF6324637.1 pilus assembly protein TadE [Nocardia cyriacigeorgica]MBF6397096.1 pilus assembly protein TadE [Nocardia cyriacigeorgica]